MKSLSRWIAGAVLAGVILGGRPAPVAAQSFWIEQQPAHSVSVEWIKPLFDQPEDLGFLTSAVFLSGRVWLLDNLAVTAEVPFAHLRVTTLFFDEQDTALGNPYVGVELGPPEAPLTGEAGLRLPVVGLDDAAAFVGIFADFDRFEAFTPDQASFVGLGTYRFRPARAFSVRLRGGGVLLVNTDPAEFEDDVEVLAAYGVQGWYAAERLRLGAGLTGRLIVTEGDLDLGARTFHQLGVAAVAVFGRLEPGLYLRLPLDDDLRSAFDLVLGLHLTLRLE